jgi:hypothetical protein
VTSVTRFDVVLSTQFNNCIRVFLKKPKTENENISSNRRWFGPVARRALAHITRSWNPW